MRRAAVLLLLQGCSGLVSASPAFSSAPCVTLGIPATLPRGGALHRLFAVQSSSSERGGDVEHHFFAHHDYRVDRAEGTSRIVSSKWSKRSSCQYPDGTRGARREKQRTEYGQLVDQDKSRLRFEHTRKELAEELETLGMKDCPVTLSGGPSARLSSFTQHAATPTRRNSHRQ